MKHVAFPLVLLAAMGSALAGGICIVQDGKPRATIVVPVHAPESLQVMAKEIQQRIEEASGAKLEIKETRPDGLVGIHIGRSAYIDSLKVDLGKRDDDGFVIRFPDSKNIVILGPTDWGTEFGVCEFLERYVGVRWLMPGPDGTDVPKQATITVPDEPVRDEPKFFSRLFSGLRGSAHGTWARRNRMHGRVKFHHHLLHLFPPKDYQKSHPEFFPVHKGKRYFPPPERIHGGWQPCFTAPGIVEEGTKNIVEYFNENPDAPSYSLGVNDSSGHCQCERCLAADPGRKNFLNRDHLSDRYFSWANQVVEGVLKSHPDKLFGCLAYSEIAERPDRVQVHERIIPYMTYDRMKWVHPELRAKGEEMTKAWHKMCPTLGWYDYIYGSAYCVPRVWFHHMGDYYRFGYANGVRALYAEAYPNFGEGPKLYVSLKLQWDPHRDVDEILDEWYERCVGPEAAPDLKAYYAHWEDFWTRRILDSPWFTEGGQYLRFNHPGYLADVAPEEAVKCRKLLESVIAKTKTEKQRARAELLLKAFEYYEASILAYPHPILGGAPVDTEEKALQVIEEAARRIAFNAKRRHLQLVEFAKHPVLVHPITMERKGREALRGDGWGAMDLWKAYDWLNRSDKVRRHMEELLKDPTYADAHPHLRMMQSVMKSDADNLLANPSFEKGKGSQADGWSYWVKWATGSMKRTDEAAHSGKFSTLCEGMRRGGPNQAVSVPPGRYGAVCFVMAPEGQKATAVAELGITLVDPEGKNITSSQAMIAPTPGRWHTMAICMDIPANVKDRKVDKARAILIVGGLDPGRKLYIDDMRLIRLGDLPK